MNWQERSVTKKKEFKRKNSYSIPTEKKTLKWYSVKICHIFDLSKTDWKAIVTLLNNLVTYFRKKNNKCITNTGTHWHSPTNVIVFYWMQCWWYRQEQKTTVNFQLNCNCIVNCALHLYGVTLCFLFINSCLRWTVIKG